MTNTNTDKEFEEFLKSDICTNCNVCDKYDYKTYQAKCFNNWLSSKGENK